MTFDKDIIGYSIAYNRRNYEGVEKVRIGFKNKIIAKEPT